MAEQWLDFIQSQSLQASPSTQCSNAIYPNTNQAFLQVQGPDACKFLQGQLSCDMAKLSLTQSGLGSHNTPKGRMLSSFRIIQNGEDSYLLNLHDSICDSALSALAKYIVFSKAEIHQNPEFGSFALQGSQSKARLATLLGTIPENDYQQLITEQGIVLCTSASNNSYQVIGNHDELISLWQALNEEIPAYPVSQQQLAQHQQGLAFVCQQTQDAFIPQMFNYQLTPAISFKKGCYTGQEIIARMQYLGKLKRHMYRYQCCSEQSLTPGDKIFIPEKNQSAGDIVSTVDLGNQHWDLLMVLTDEAANASRLQTEQQPLTQLQQLTLP